VIEVKTFDAIKQLYYSKATCSAVTENFKPFVKKRVQRVDLLITIKKA
jgi:hypothetical protein